jgi:hypothetical protein
MLFTDQALDPRDQLVAFLRRQEPLCHKLMDHQDVHVERPPFFPQLNLQVPCA